MGNESFDGQLSKHFSNLNNSQKSIESLSKWCISHRKKARQIVESWDKFFTNSSHKEQRIAFLHLANDILQNSRRIGSEFVNEFWKVLPAALKHVYENGVEQEKKVVTRLVEIWEGRKVFGSRGQNLKDEMLAKNPPPLSTSQVKSSNPIKSLKRDAHSVRIKLAVGGLPEKIITAFESVLDEHSNEEAALNKCNTALQCMGRIEEDIEKSMTQGNQLGSGLQDELQEQEDVLCQCLEKLDSAEAHRISLVSLLKEALQEQESKLARIRSKLQVARRQIEQARNIRNGIKPLPVLAPSTNVPNSTPGTTMVFEQSQTTSQPSSVPSQPLVQPAISFAPLKSSDEERKKAAAAAVAARLAASTSSAQMLTSVLSSLVAEESASMNGGLTSAGSTSGLPMFSPEKRQKLDKPMSFPDTSNSEIGGAPGFFTPISSLALAPPSTGVQSMSQGNSMQSNFAPPLPPPLSQSSTTPPNQYVQATSHVAGVMPFGYGSNTLPPAPPMPPQFAVGMARPNMQPQPQHSPQQQQQPPQLQPPNGAFYRPPGMGFYGQSHQPTTPPVHRQ